MTRHKVRLNVASVDNMESIFSIRGFSELMGRIDGVKYVSGTPNIGEYLFTKEGVVVRHIAPAHVDYIELEYVGNREDISVVEQRIGQEARRKDFTNEDRFLPTPIVKVNSNPRLCRVNNTLPRQHPFL